MIPASVIVILEILVKYGPEVAAKAKELLSGKEPTDADWNALFEKAQEPWVESSKELK